MPRFFVDAVVGNEVTVTGEDAAHIARSLRMTVGEALTVCDGSGTDYQCTVTAVSPQAVTAQIVSQSPSIGEPTVRVTLFQGLPKGEKMDWIVQKAVELGVAETVPFVATRSISRPDDKSVGKKTERWQKIADEAAKQSQRGKCPAVQKVCSFAEAQKAAERLDCNIVFYEGGGVPLPALLAERHPTTIGIWVGPEGGWAPDEVAQIEAMGGVRATLGPRILRTETAPLAALTAVMLLTGNMN